MRKYLLFLITMFLCLPLMAVPPKKKVNGRVTRPVKKIDQSIEHDTLSPPVTLADSIVFEASKHLGKPYHLGSKGPKVFDCSGFTSYVFKQLGFNLGSNSYDQSRQGVKISKEHVHKGDLIFFAGRDARGGIGHVGIVFDVNPDGKSFRFIHSCCSKGVSIAPYPDNGYYSKRFRCIRRMVDVASPAPLPIDNTFHSLTPPPVISLNESEGNGEIDLTNNKETIHIVKQGDNLAKIAQRYGCTPNQIMKWNNLKSNKLNIRQQLIIKPRPKKDDEHTREIIEKAEQEKYANAINVKITVNKGDDIYSVSQKYNCTVKEIATWNHLKGNELKEGQELVIRPLDNSVKKDTILDGMIIHTVAKGENIFQISRKYGCQVKEIKLWNNLPNNLIQPGKKLKIKRASDQGGVHVVREGETLEAVAVKYDVSIEELRDWNHLTSNDIRPGRFLKVTNDITEFNKAYNKNDSTANEPAAPLKVTGTTVQQPLGEGGTDSTTTVPTAITDKNKTEDSENIYYKVQGGDTFSKIALKYKTTSKQILIWNGLDNYKLRPGQKLIVGKKKVQAVATQAKAQEAAPVKSVKDAPAPKVQEPTAKKQPEAVTKKAQEPAAKKEAKPADNSQKTLNADGNIVHTVVNGDNLYNIARKNHCTVKQLMEWNNLKNDKLRLGQKIIIKQ